MARKGCGVKEVTLEGIYGVLVQWGTIRAETAARLAALELEVEEELLEVNPVRAKQLGEERRKGRAIAFVSDMYVPEGWLRRQLEIRGLMEDGDGLYCSSASGMTKRSGELFGKVLSETGRSAGEVLHVGDHEVADVAVPRGLGMGAEQVRETRLTPYEEILESFGVQTGGVTTVMAGMSRLVRLRDEAEHGHGGEGGGLGAVTCGVAGPILSAYVLWVLRKAREDGLEALYFLARDGQILLEVAKVLAPLGGSGGRMGYLHVSRQALRLPGVDHEVPDLGWIGERAGEFTVRELLARAELVPEMVPGVLGRHGFPVDAVDRVVGADGVERFGLVLKDPELVAVVVGQSRATRELLIG
jgi:predicted HAD superfamily hydrolase